MARLRRITSIGTSAIFIAVIAAIAVLSLPFSGFRALSVQTGSMKPKINPGALVVTRRVVPQTLQVGNVITYTNPIDKKTTITHRIQQITSLGNGRNQFIVKGDANPVADAPVQESQIIGRVAWSVPYLGRAVDFVRSPIGLILMIYVPALMIGWSEMRLLVQRLTRLELAKRGIRSVQPLTPAMAGGGTIPGRMPPLSVLHQQHEHFQAATQQPQRPTAASKSTALGLVVGVAIIAGALVPTFAALTSNSVTLSATSISTASTPASDPAPGSTDVSTDVRNNTNITIENNVQQSAASGNVTVNGTADSTSAASGTATNQNAASVGVSVQR